MNGQEQTDLQNKYKEQMKAWMMIQVIGQTTVNFLNVKKLAKEMRQHLATLLATGAAVNGSSECPEETAGSLDEFAEYFITSCKGSKSYRSAIFGTMTMSDEGANTRLEEEIDLVTRQVPERFGLEGSFEPVRTAFLNALKRVQ